jgi:hypothetical protein
MTANRSMPRIILQVLAVVVSIWMLTACASPKPAISSLPTPPRSPVQPPSPLQPATHESIVDVPAPSQNKAAISGLFYSYTSKQEVPQTLFYLTPAVGPDKLQMPALLTGPEVSAGDIQGQTDQLGQFTLNDIPPGNYYLIIWAPPYSWSEAQMSPNDPSPRLISLSPNQSLPLGTVYVSWP